ncbi:MAG: FAD-dependent oxidoreductase [Microcystaceae cyanobacterium]
MEILDVAIIGAGPGGLAAAHSLAKLGFSVAVFEKAKAFRPIGAALGLSDMGYDALANINPDLATQIRKLAANPQYQLLMRPNGEILFSDESPFKGTNFTWLAWYSLQTCLRNTLPNNVSVHLNHALIDFQYDANSYLKLNFQGQDDVYSKLLIGADGYHSSVREKTVGDGQPLYTGTMTWRGIFSRQKLALDFPFNQGNGFQLVVGEGKNFCIMDSGNNLIAWGATALQESSQKSPSPLLKLQQVFSSWLPFVNDFIKVTEPNLIVETGVFDRESVSQWGDNTRVTLLGDAAHPIRPSLGLGTTMALQDAIALSQAFVDVKLDDTAQVSSAIQTYEQERIKVTTPLLEKARQGGLDAHAEDIADLLKIRFEKQLAAVRENS